MTKIFLCKTVLKRMPRPDFFFELFNRIVTYVKYTQLSQVSLYMVSCCPKLAHKEYLSQSPQELT